MMPQVMRVRRLSILDLPWSVRMENIGVRIDPVCECKQAAFGSGGGRVPVSVPCGVCASCFKRRLFASMLDIIAREGSKSPEGINDRHTRSIGSCDIVLQPCAL